MPPPGSSQHLVDGLRQIVDATVTLELANDKTFILRNAIEASDGTVGTENANAQVRFEGEGEDG